MGSLTEQGVSRSSALNRTTPLTLAFAVAFVAAGRHVAVAAAKMAPVWEDMSPAKAGRCNRGQLLGLGCAKVLTVLVVSVHETSALCLATLDTVKTTGSAVMDAATYRHVLALDVHMVGVLDRVARQLAVSERIAVARVIARALTVWPSNARAPTVKPPLAYVPAQPVPKRHVSGPTAIMDAAMVATHAHLPPRVLEATALLRMNAMTLIASTVAARIATTVRVWEMNVGAAAVPTVMMDDSLAR